jgi:hypothetical protein
MFHIKFLIIEMQGFKAILKILNKFKMKKRDKIKIISNNKII